MSAAVIPKRKIVLRKGPVCASLTPEQRKVEAQKIQRELETLKQRVRKLAE